MPTSPHDLTAMLRRLQACTGKSDRKWNETWAGIIRAVERQKGGADPETAIRERWELFAPKTEFPEEEVA